MAINEQRLSLFALLSEFEADAREIIGSVVCPDHSIESDIGSEAYLKLVERALPTGSDGDERGLLTHLDMGDSIKILLTNRSLLTAKLTAALNKLTKQLEALTAVRNRVMHRRPLEFDDLPLATDVLRTLAQADKQAFARTAAILKSVASGQVSDDYVRGFAFESGPTTLSNLPQADFDDTGFMGRREEIDELRKAILGPFPVITVLGVGGAGKSALALHVAYDILNDPNSVFDAIIWTSAKTNRLTGTDVEEIAGAISSSVGIAEYAADQFGVSGGEDPFEEVKSLLKEFKVLLFIDNLETILDERVRNFVRDIPSGSKVVFTSRIGLGAYDFVVPVNNLDPKPAAAYLRRVAAVWKQSALASASNELVSSYCVRLNHSPLGIKWFVQAIASGASPQKLLADPAALLAFCLENIIDKLGAAAKSLLNVLAITGRQQSPASLQYISNIEPWEIEAALRELIASNLITVIIAKFGEEDRYRISPLAQAYVSRLFPPSGAMQATVRKRQAQLTALSERAEGEKFRGFVFDPIFLFIRREFAGTDAVAATYLRRAMANARAGRWDKAFSEVGAAKQIAPSYFEVLRVEAYVCSQEGNSLRAQSAYEEAMALKPDYPPLACLYAAFLVRALDDGPRAEKLLRGALAIDNESPEIKLELSRCLLYQSKFPDAWDTLQLIDKDKLRNSRAWRMYFDLLVQVCTRSAERYLEEDLWVEFTESMEKLELLMNDMPDHVIDVQVEKHLSLAVALARHHLATRPKPQLREKTQRALDAICSRLSIPVVPAPRARPVAAGARVGGRVCALPAGQSYGFIEGDDGQRLFFHLNNLLDKSEFALLGEGTVVAYAYGRNAQGVCADDVAVVQR